MSGPVTSTGGSPLNICRAWLSNDLVRRYGADSLWMFAARCCWIISALTVGIAVTRKLGPYDFGLLNYAIAYAGMFSIIPSLGVDSLITRDLIARPDDRDRILGNFFLFKLMLTALMFVLLGASVYISGLAWMTAWLCVLTAAGYINGLCVPCQVYFTATVKNNYNAYAQIGACLIYSGVRLAGVFLDWPLWGFAVAECVQMLTLGGISLCLYLYHEGSLRRWTGRPCEALRMLIPAIPLSISCIFGNIYARTDMLMLEYFNGPEQVGYYAIATRFTENWAIFGSIFATVFSSAVLSAKLVSDSEYRKQLHRYFFVLCWSTMPLIAVSLLLGRWIIGLLYGAAFLPSAGVFYLYVLTLPMTGILGGYGWYATNENRLYAIAGVLCSGAMLNVIVNALLIPRFGMNGAAVSSLICMPVGMGSALLCTKAGRADIRLICSSVFTFPSMKLASSR